MTQCWRCKGLAAIGETGSLVRAGDVLMRVKVCGLKLLRDVRLAEWAGAEYVGFVVEAPSPRAVSREVAGMLARAARAKTVYVVVDMAPDELAAVLEVQRPAAVQLHGQEDADYVGRLRQAVGEDVELWKAVAVGSEEDIAAAERRLAELAEAGIARIVVDTRVGGRGTEAGGRLDFGLAAEAVNRLALPCVLAGGLTPQVLPELWRVARPWAVDLSSGLESQPGRKDPAKMKRLAAVISAAGS